MSAMEVTETSTAESEQMKEQVEEMQQQKLDEAKKVLYLNLDFRKHVWLAGGVSYLMLW